MRLHVPFECYVSDPWHFVTSPHNLPVRRSIRYHWAVLGDARCFREGNLILCTLLRDAITSLSSDSPQPPPVTDWGQKYIGASKELKTNQGYLVAYLTVLLKHYYMYRNNY